MSKNTSQPEAVLDSLQQVDDYWRGSFFAMGSPCQCLVATDSEQIARQLSLIALAEAKRIETKFSRYRTDNIIYQINNAAGKAVEVDDETANLLDFAAQCYELSEGLFDVTSGVLREAWQFDGSDNVPDQSTVEKILPRVGWAKVDWQRPLIWMQQGMQIDLGGIGKEYAVDQASKLVREQAKGVGVLINFGGDLVATGPRLHDVAWTVGIDDPAKTGQQAVAGLNLKKGALATSGDARRFLLKDGVRYSHILNPQTGWPVMHAPRSVSVIANTCIEAGMLSTFAMLHGEHAREFLQEQEVTFWMVD